jgi:hypothetical protein
MLINLALINSKGFFDEKHTPAASIRRIKIIALYP